MNFIFSTLKKILFWSYERGTWQYDVMCVLILAFVFAMPNGVLESRSRPVEAHRGYQDGSHVEAIFIPQEEVGPVDQDRVSSRLTELLRAKYGRTVTIKQIDPQYDAQGRLSGYAVYER